MHAAPVFRAQTFLNGRNIKGEREGEGVICGYGFNMQEAEEITSLLEMLDENPVELTME